MKKFETLTAIVAPLDRHNVDTDAIIPKQFLKSIHRSGFGPNLFDEWRYLDRGEPGMDSRTRPLNPDFVLNQPRYRDAGILLARENFGCGSSREHAVWALLDAGFRVVIAPGFADIFHNNCFKNGVLPISLDAELVDRLFGVVEKTPGYRLSVDLGRQIIETPDHEVTRFNIDGFHRQCLLDGLDDIGMTYQHEEEIHRYEERRRKEVPWLFNEID